MDSQNSVLCYNGSEVIVLEIDIIALASIACSAAVSISSIYRSNKAAENIEEIKTAHAVEFETLKARLNNESEMKNQQVKILSEMTKYAIEMENGDFSSRSDFLALALKLAATADANSLIGQNAESLVQALTLDFENRNKIEWIYLIERCARSINYHGHT